jgi:hypothetical protein
MCGSEKCTRSNSPGILLGNMFKIKSDNQPKSGYQQNSHAPINNENRTWKALKPGEKKNNTNDGERTDAACFNYVEQISDTRITPHTSI